MNTISSRRNFLKKFGRTSAGIVAISTLAAGAEKVKQGSTMAKDEIDKLRELKILSVSPSRNGPACCSA